MSAPLSIPDRLPTASVAIIGNDAVLAAAPATPVQLAHACLRRGFSVAVPASWGDELVSTEVVRRLSSRERGPAVMCVCPYVRSRLLTPGPDLAPFLVSLVSPPVAVARYLRAVYADAGVYITYIGECPSAHDPAIDACLTPDAFLAELAEYDIALSEQPLVFDSIVPPDRRRWCSLPGGVPTAEVLWSESDTRTLIEIDPDDVSTDLAQHIIAREHVLLDLAPSLGCACSGAIGSVPPRSARVAVTSVEPPRALGPVIDSISSVSLESPLTPSVTSSGPQPVAPAESAERAPHDLVEARLDEMLGSQSVTDAPLSPAAPETEGMVVMAHAAVVALFDAADGRPPTSTDAVPPAAELDTTPPPVEGETPADHTTAARTADVPSAEPPTAAPADVRAPSDTAVPSRVRRHTPASVVARQTPTSIPRVTASDGRPLPRAYAAKRRPPVMGVVTIPEPNVTAGADQGARPHAEPPEGAADARAAVPEAGVSSIAESPNESLGVQRLADATPSAIDAVPAPEPTGSDTPSSRHDAPEQPDIPAAKTEPPPADALETARPVSDEPSASVAPPRDKAPHADRGHGGAAAVSDNNPSALVVLLVALLALGFFVLRSLN